MRYALAFCLAVSATVAAQQPSGPPRALTAADYARAERFMTYNTTPLVLRSGVRPAWTVCTRALMRPNSVDMPVATTTA